MEIFTLMKKLILISILSFAISGQSQVACFSLFKSWMPDNFLQSQTSKILIANDSEKIGQENIELSESNRNSFLDAVYRHGLIRADEKSQLLSDKLIFYEAAMRGGKSTQNYLPLTLGLKSFLKTAELLNDQNEIETNSIELQKILLQLFPNGFVVKPATGFSSDGKGAKFYFSEEAFIQDLLKSDSHLYQPQEFDQPFYSDVLGAFASGESLILQAKAIPITSSPLNNQNQVEFRLHTYERRVVKGASFGRWLQPLDPAKMSLIESRVEEFLQALPEEMVNRSAWGLDVIYDGKNLQIIDVNTNRGNKIQWSGYLPSPFVLQAYAQHFQNLGLVNWVGYNALEILSGRGNIQQWIQKLPEEVEAYYRNLNLSIPDDIAKALQKNKAEKLDELL